MPAMRTQLVAAQTVARALADLTGPSSHPSAKGLYPVVKASLTGSIIGNVLLVLGAAVLAGGIKYKEQKFNATAARAQSRTQ